MSNKVCDFCKETVTEVAKLPIGDMCFSCWEVRIRPTQRKLIREAANGNVASQCAITPDKLMKSVEGER
jgi:hypothetical protein